MLEALGKELLAEVLQRLPPADLKHARLSCRAADAAARSHLDAFTRITLTPDNTGGGGPAWARCPRLQSIRLKRWFGYNAKPEQAKQLQQLFPLPLAGGAPAALASVTTLRFENCGNLEPATATAVLQVLPGLTALELPLVVDAVRTTTLLCVVAVLAPRLRTLDASLCTTLAGAAAIGGLRQLRALQLGEVAEDAEWPAVLAALPAAQLTSLGFWFQGPARLLGALPWPQLRQLRSVALTFDEVAPLAASMPQLELLVARPVGEWGPAPAAGFKSVTHAFFYCCDDAFGRVRLSALVPAVQTLVLDPNDIADAPDYQLQGLTALTSLHLFDPNGDSMIHAVNEATLTALRTLPSLAHLAVVMSDFDLPALAQLMPTTLKALDLRVYSGEHFSATLHADAALFALSHLSALTALRFDMSWEDNTDATSVAIASQANLVRFHSTFPCLHELILIEPLLHSYEAAALCAHPALRKLAVRMANRERNRAAFERLAADHAARGLNLLFDFAIPESYTLFDNSWANFAI